MTGRLIIAFLMLPAILLFTLFDTSLAAEVKSDVLVAKEASEWTAIFDRRGETGWLGADGIYSVSLDGNDAFGSANDGTTTFFIFSDTLMGTAQKSGEVTDFAGMPAQTSALFTGNSPKFDDATFIYGFSANGNPGEHLFGEHKWMLDCYVQGESLYILGFPQKDWKPEQIDMITIPIRDGKPIYEEYSETENISELWHKIGDEHLYAFGIGITANTASAGAPSPDGYIYIYGYRDAIQEMSRKDLIVGRIHENDFPDFSKFTYWNGDGWVSTIEDCAILLCDVSCEMSVTAVTTGPFSGKYIAVYTAYTRSSDIMYAIGDTPVGPFDTPVKCYTAIEHGQVGASGHGTRVVYNAKAHPHLSRGDKLLISYNVNVEGDAVSQWTTDYHPRFLWLDLDPDKDEPLELRRGYFTTEAFVIAGAAVLLGASVITCTIIKKRRYAHKM